MWSTNNNLTTWWLKSLAILMLGGALYSFPFFYYQLMDWVVSIVAILYGIRAYHNSQPWLMWIYVLILVIFNPIAPIHLRADVWQITDILTGLFLIASFAFTKDK